MHQRIRHPSKPWVNSAGVAIHAMPRRIVPSRNGWTNACLARALRRAVLQLRGSRVGIVWPDLPLDRFTARRHRSGGQRHERNQQREARSCGRHGCLPFDRNRPSSPAVCSRCVRIHSSHLRHHCCSVSLPHFGGGKGAGRLPRPAGGGGPSRPGDALYRGSFRCAWPWLVDCANALPDPRKMSR